MKPVFFKNTLDLVDYAAPCARVENVIYSAHTTQTDEKTIKPVSLGSARFSLIPHETHRPHIDWHLKCKIHKYTVRLRTREYVAPRLGEILTVTCARKNSRRAVFSVGPRTTETRRRVFRAGAGRRDRGVRSGQKTARWKWKSHQQERCAPTTIVRLRAFYDRR